MTKKVFWLLLTCLIAGTLVLTSCGPAAEPEEGKTITGKVVEKKVEEEKKEEVVTPVAKEPQYGGILKIIGIGAAIDPITWDPADCLWLTDYHNCFFQENLLVGDLSRGPRGTNEFGFNFTAWIPDDLTTGELAESWEQPETLTVIFHIRKGVSFPDKPGVMTSREMTAKDVEFSLNRVLASPRCPKGRFDWVESITATDKYTVVLKMSKFHSNWMAMIAWGAAYVKIYPPELVDAGIADWKNAVGTGPFMLTDYVKGASLTFDKNPIYWGKTTIDGKEYKTPFVDRLLLPIIPDASTQLAAMRTGKADIQEAVSWQDKDSLERTNPNLLRFQRLVASAPSLIMRVDTPPFDDIRVRKALCMAVDREAFLESQLGGEGVYLSWPMSAAWPRSIYTPLEEMPESVQELFTYNPEKAMQLLAEAGYPDGFKVETVTTSAAASIDFASAIKSYLADIGVELEIKPYDYATYSGITFGRKYKHTIATSQGNSNPFAVIRSRVLPGDPFNYSMFNDPEATDMVDQIEAEVNVDEKNRLIKELNIYYLEQATDVLFPTGYTYCYAWPWVKNYFGEIETKFYGPAPVYATIWLDQSLKKSMGY
jgi:peptide/nickel transport system substrate-binding protein